MSFLPSAWKIAGVIVRVVDAVRARERSARGWEEPARVQRGEEEVSRGRTRRLNRWPWRAESFKNAEWSTFRGPSESRSHGRPNCIQTLHPLALTRACSSFGSLVLSPALVQYRTPYELFLHSSSFSSLARARETKSGSSRIRRILLATRKSTGRTAARFARHARHKKFTPMTWIGV